MLNQSIESIKITWKLLFAMNPVSTIKIHKAPARKITFPRSKILFTITFFVSSGEGSCRQLMVLGLTLIMNYEFNQRSLWFKAQNIPGKCLIQKMEAEQHNLEFCNEETIITSSAENQGNKDNSCGTKSFAQNRIVKHLT